MAGFSDTTKRSSRMILGRPFMIWFIRSVLAAVLIELAIIESPLALGEAALDHPVQSRKHLEELGVQPIQGSFL